MSKDHLEQKDADLTPLTGAATDVAPLGRRGEKPAHELTADEDVDVVDWEAVAVSIQFSQLVAAKRRFIPTCPDPMRVGAPTVTSVPNTSLKKAESMFSSVYSLFAMQATVVPRSAGTSVVACCAASCDPNGS